MRLGFRVVVVTGSGSRLSDIRAREFHGAGVQSSGLTSFVPRSIVWRSNSCITQGCHRERKGFPCYSTCPPPRLHLNKPSYPQLSLCKAE